MNARKAMPLVVDLPKAGEDHPSWMKVGVIAAAGFAIGVIWPRLAGVRLGPSLPVEAAPSAMTMPSASAPPVTAAPPLASASATPPPVPAPPPVVEPPSVTVNRGVVLSCKTEDGDTLKGTAACGRIPGFDAIAQPRLRRLASCPAAVGATGKLSIVFTVDFPLNKVALEIGKSSTVTNLEAFGACVRPAFQGVSLGALDHQNPHYSLFYSLIFGPKDAAPSATGAVATSAPSASGAATASASTATTPAASPVATDDTSAQVVWEVAIVRDAPRTGQVLARLPRGTKVNLGTTQDGWYRVKYGTDLSSDGWVYRGAIGR